MLPALLNVPRTDLEWQRWGFHHRTSHQLIRQAIQQQRSVSLPDYQIYPIYLAEPRVFLQYNQSAHTDMNNVLGKPGSDLEDVDLKNERQLNAWIWLHYLEHRTAETTLRVGS